jgi:hypothetical protein
MSVPSRFAAKLLKSGEVLMCACEQLMQKAAGTRIGAQMGQGGVL